ncbi:MAG: phosphate acyltransferase PlsX [Bacteroidia bacterium]|nr:phosphate acyltransferase PlsX [Bacteroidia bacterium]
MRIAVDAMGGDFAPNAVVAGAYQAAREDKTSILLVGDGPTLEKQLTKQGELQSSIEIVHAEQVVGMDESPITPLRKKKQSSIRICGELVKEGRAQAMVSAGNTGAALIVAKTVIGSIKGVDRPALATVFPSPRGGTVVLDVGANIDSKPEHLRQFAVMGHFYAQEILGTASPRVGLMSIGEEESKGSDLTKAVFAEMKATGFNFVGNVEGRDVFRGSVDVIVCDGFVGNVLLKSAESLAGLMSGMMKDELSKTWRTRLGYSLARPAFERFRRRVDYREYGAAPLLGVEAGCFIGHGRSNPRAIRNSIRRAVEFCAADLHNKIRDRVAELHAQEERLLEARLAEEAPAT